MSRRSAMPNWMSFGNAVALVVSSGDPPPSNDEAGRWILDQAVAGGIRVTDAHPSLSEILEHHRQGEPQMWESWFVARARWSGADIKAELQRSAPGRVTIKRGRKPNWDWSAMEAEAERRFEGVPRPWKHSALIATLQEIAIERGLRRPSDRHCRDVADRIRAKYPEHGGISA